MANLNDTLKGLLGDNADDKLGSIMSALNLDSMQSPPPSGGIPPELLMQAQGLMKSLTSAGGDSRSNLLMSLKPYMREERRGMIDNAVKLLNIARLAQLFGNGGFNV